MSLDAVPHPRMILFKCPTNHLMTVIKNSSNISVNHWI